MNLSQAVHFQNFDYFIISASFRVSIFTRYHTPRAVHEWKNESVIKVQAGILSCYKIIRLSEEISLPSYYRGWAVGRNDLLHHPAPSFVTAELKLLCCLASRVCPLWCFVQDLGVPAHFAEQFV